MKRCRTRALISPGWTCDSFDSFRSSVSVGGLGTVCVCVVCVCGVCVCVRACKSVQNLVFQFDVQKFKD